MKRLMCPFTSVFFVLSMLLPLGTADASDRTELLRQSQRIIFLGDSITFGGHYVAFFDAWLLTQGLDDWPTVIDVGLPSKTVSGLSEDGHAGGRFPRPDLAERLDRVLALTKPDLVFACYGINCGIYQPLNDDRFRRYQDGIRHLKLAAQRAPAEVMELVRKRMNVLRDAYVSAAGHKRPGVRAGLPVPEALQKASLLKLSFSIVAVSRLEARPWLGIT